MCLGNIFHANGQRVSEKDTLSGKKKKTFLHNKIKVVSKDTIIYLLDTVSEKTNVKSTKNGDEFYQSLKQGAYKRKFTKELYKLFFVSPDKLTPTDTLKTERSEAAFVQYQGKTIRNISVRVLEPFGSTLYDTTKVAISWIETSANKLHHTTSRRHLKKLLRIKEGESVDAYNLADNERLIRQLSYIKDAYFRVIPVLNSPHLVDLELWVKDQFSWGANMSVGSLTSTDFELYSRNLYGIGHEFSNKVEYDSKKDQQYGYTGKYKIRNIRKSFIDASLLYQNNYEKAVLGLELEKKFETYNTKFAGGFSISQTMRSDEIEDEDPILNEIPLDFNYGSLWIGRSYKVKTQRPFARRRLFLAASIASREFYERPEVGPFENQFFHNNNLYLASVSLNQIQYYKSNLIYNFGRTEDIPYGFLTQVTFGYEDREFSHRNYLGFDFQKAIYFNKSRSYFFNRIAIGGFFNSKRFEQGVLQAQTKFFTRIHQLGALRFRNFGNLQYTLGIRRFPEEFVSLLSERGIRGFDKESVTGTQKLVLNLESVAFTPYTLGGFRFAFYSFADLGFIGSNSKYIFKEKFYYGVGVGVRLNNENLVFKTIQFRFAFYPKAPIGFDNYEYQISGEERPKFNSFQVGQPNTVEFK